MTAKSYLVTGGTGFIGSALVRRLVRDGFTLRVLDNNVRGSQENLSDIADDFQFIEADVRDADKVSKAVKGVDGVLHLAYINGTEFFYSKPEYVLDVGVKGMVNVLDGCRKHGIGELIVASSSEVYQTPKAIPTDESVPLSIPDPSNPRYSYGGGKILCELMALNYGRKEFDKVIVFRPHNVYGPNMGWEHVLPQFVLRMKEICQKSDAETVLFPIQGTGQETRAFNFIDDFVDGLRLMMDRGEHLNIYHIGTSEEITIQRAAELVGQYYGRAVEIVPGVIREGGTPRRCPDISKLEKLGYTPKVTLQEGFPILADWYDKNADLAPMR